MNRIIDVRPGDRVAVVQPGALNGDLQVALKEHGLFWPPDPNQRPVLHHRRQSRLLTPVARAR
jgi:FAD/FMN-containing dehydrogenase